MYIGAREMAQQIRTLVLPGPMSVTTDPRDFMFSPGLHRNPYTCNIHSNTDTHNK